MTLPCPRRAVRASLLPWLALGVACDGAPAPAARVFPAVSALPERSEPPDPFLTFFEPRAIETAEAWEAQRVPELRELFQHYVYGFFPPAPTVKSRVRIEGAPLFEGRVRYRELELELTPAVRVRLALFLPPERAAPPVFLALNPCGNQSLVADEPVASTEAWRSPSCPPGRGGHADRWPVETIVARGYALATFHESEIDPDDPADERFSDGLHPHLSPGVGFRTQWARIAAWAFGLSRAVDHLVHEAEVDGARIIVTGHSRRGKAALLAAAFDPRIAMAIPHQSGTGGATLSRDNTGESIERINAAFPAWFNRIFPEFAGQETRLPIDQHLLLGLVAPRPLLVTNGADDFHANPAGALRAVRAAAPIYELYGRGGLMLEEDGRPSLEGRLAWHERPGGHSTGLEDWLVFLEFADRHL